MNMRNPKNGVKSEWMKPLDCALALGVHPATFKAKAASLGIRCRVIPGINGRYFHRGDFERLLADLKRREEAALAKANRPSAKRAKTARSSAG